MKTLHELATKLQEYIINSQQDAHNSTNMSVTKYNNLKLRMEATELKYPNIIVRIGISEAIYNFADGTKTDGSLGPDEKYVRKWLGSSTVLADLKEIYNSLNDLVKIEDEEKAVSMEGEAEEAKQDAPRRKRKFRNPLDTLPLDGETADAEQDESPQEDEKLFTVEEVLSYIENTKEDDAPEAAD